MWLFLFGFLIYGVKRNRWVGLIALAIMLIIVFRPEWDDALRGMRRYQIASLKTSTPTSAPPYHLTVFDAPSDESALLALAESGLFDVTISNEFDPTKFTGRVVVEESDKCKTRGTNFAQFTAATGFKRCGRLISAFGSLPPEHLVLWADPAPLLPRSRWAARQRAFQLSEQSRSETRLLAYCETSSPLKREMFDRLVVAFRRITSDCRNPVTQDTYAMSNPDLVNFVFKGVGIKPADTEIGNQPGNSRPISR